MKTLLIVFGSVLAIMVLIIIIAAWVPSFEKKKMKVSQTTPSAPKTKRKWQPALIWLIVIGIGLWLGIGWWKGRTAEPVISYPVAADAQDIWPQIGETVNIKIRPDCWSGWVNLPLEERCRPVIDAPGEVEYLFLNGKRKFVPDNGEWWEEGRAESCSFRLRGKEGIATIKVFRE